MISKRARSMEASGIRKAFDLGARLKNPLNLSIGQPDFDVPEETKRVAIEAIKAGRNAYAPSAGLPEARSALQAHIGRRYGWEPEDVIVTAGVSGGLALAMLATLDPGDEILVPDPYFVSYKQLPAVCGARPVFYDVHPDWKVDAGKVEGLVTPRTKVLLVNSPANPTGAALSEEELRGLAEVARRHDLLVLSDEVYDDFYYDGPAPPTFGKLWAKTLVLNGFSKSQAMTGWRVGWAAGPRELVAEMTKINQFTFVTVPPAFQLAAAASLTGRQSAVGGGRKSKSLPPDATHRLLPTAHRLPTPAAGHLDAYRAKRDLICGKLAGRFEFRRPGGAFYLFPKAPWGTGTEFVAAAIEERVLTIPGNVFSERDTHFRISFAAPDAVLEEAGDILARLAERGPAKA
jgi:aspartate/methionine/tyrosine aminotransferase